MGEIKKCQISIASNVDGTELFRKFEGEYLFKDDTHNIAYTDYSGNVITKNALQANSSAMLLHRVGGFSGDMFFDLNCDTVVNYGAFMVGCGFALHTYEYSLMEHENGLTIRVRYGLNDGKAEEISGQQSITIKFAEENG
ncbi:MAG: DUF1934 family protein [Oscillospiraceae bacterium]